MFSGSPNCLESNIRKSLQSFAVIPLFHRFQFLHRRPFATPHQSNSNDSSVHTLLEVNRSSFNCTLSKPRKSNRDHIEEPSKYRDVPPQPSQNPSKAPATPFQSEDETPEQATLQAIIDERRARKGLVERKLCLGGREQRTYHAAAGSTSSTSRQGRSPKNWPASTKDSRWEVALRLLANFVPQCKEAEGEEMRLSKSTLIMSSGTPAANSWVHQTRGGCEVQVTDSQYSSGTARQVLLRGSPRAVALTKEYFLSLEEMVMRQREPHSGSSTIALHDGMTSKGDFTMCKSNAESHSTPRSDLVRPFRFVLAKDRRRLKHDNCRLAYGLPSQYAYSVPSFLQCVEDLTTMRVPRLERRELYGPRDDRHNQVVAEQLFHLFTDTITASFALF